MRWMAPFKHMFVPGLAALFCLFLFFSSGHWKADTVIRGDAHGYCSYLASWFVYHDVDFSFYESLPHGEQWRYWVHRHEGGGYFPKLTMGLAIAQAPAYLLAHVLAEPLGYEANGWSFPYHTAIGLNGIFFFFIGCYCLYRWLLRYFSAFISGLTVLMMATGTSLAYYAGPENSISHVYSFSFLAVALFLFDRWTIAKRPWLLWGAALFFGWIVLIRPTNVVFLLVPGFLVLFDRETGGSLRLRDVLVSAVFFVLPILPQLAFWKMMTGHWVFYSYGEERIWWAHPHIVEGLFSYRNGWLLYTPLMALALAGMCFTFRISKLLSIAVPVTVGLHIYIVFSWWCWYYGNSLSIRPMLDIYPLLAFPLAGFFRKVLSYDWLVWVFTLLLCATLVFNNFLQMQQYHLGMLSGSAMTKKAFYTLLFNTDPPSHLYMTGGYANPDNDRLLLGKPERMKRDTIIEKEVAHLDFDDGEGEYYVHSYDGRAFRLSEHNLYSPVLSVSAAEVTTPYDRTLGFSCMVWSEDFKKAKVLFVINFRDGETNHGYHAADLAKMGLRDGEWNRVDLYLREPRELPDAGRIEAYLWSQGKGAVLMDDVRLRQLDCPFSEAL